MLAEPASYLSGRASEPSRADLAPQRGGILAAFGKPRVQIREMRINDAVARSRRALGKLRRLGVFAHCSACQLHRAGNGEQSLAGTMAASYLLIEFQTPGAVVQANTTAGFERCLCWEVVQHGDASRRLWLGGRPGRRC